MNTQPAEIKRVDEIPENFILLQNSQDIHATLESIGKLDRLDDTGCLFAEVLDGDYGRVFLCQSFTPYLVYPVERLQ